jgi:beta-galactosidase
VEQGGTLVSEGLPGYFGDHGHVGTVQPNYGLHEVFGANEIDVQFMPDISDEMTFQLKGTKLYGRYFRQAYKLNGGTEAGQYADGMTAAVQNRFGQGRTLLIGTFPGAGYSLHHDPATKDVFAGLLDLAEIEQTAKIGDTSVQARLHRGTGGAYLWVTNPTRDARAATVTLSQAAGNFSSGEDIWGNGKVMLDGGQITVDVPGRDAAVIALR